MTKSMYLPGPKVTVLDSSVEWAKELYEEADRKTAEKFGKDSPAYKTITNGIDIENITGSQFFWNTNLGLYLPKTKKVTSLKNWEQINDSDEEFLIGFYTDAPQIVLRTREPSYEKNRQILVHLCKQVKKEDYDFSSENPLIISGLEFKASSDSNNAYGLLLKIGDNTKLENDERFAYSNNGKQIKFGDKQKIIYTKEKGLSGVYLNRNGDLYSDDGDLAYSCDYGRVVIVDAEGVAPKNLDSFKEEYETLRAEIEQKKKDLISRIQKL